jgi:predicted transcriptional regulator
LRGRPANWTQTEWSLGTGEREQMKAVDFCFGFGHGFFEWSLPVTKADLLRAQRVKVICEVSSHRADNPQTDDEIFPTTFQIMLNDMAVYQGVIRNHPHDARGVLSYLRGGVGAYGYLVHAFAEGKSIEQIAGNSAGDTLRLRCAVPPDSMAQGGLTVYGAECGRFPICPTVIVEW